MIDLILNHSELAGTQFVLQTGSAFGLYEKFGFATSGKLMTR